MDAVAGALVPLGVDYLDMPATSERVWAAIRVAHPAGAGATRRTTTRVGKRDQTGFRAKVRPSPRTSARPAPDDCAEAREDLVATAPTLDAGRSRWEPRSRGNGIGRAPTASCISSGAGIRSGFSAGRPKMGRRGLGPPVVGDRVAPWPSMEIVRNSFPAARIWRLDPIWNVSRPCGSGRGVHGSVTVCRLELLPRHIVFQTGPTSTSVLAPSCVVSLGLAAARVAAGLSCVGPSWPHPSNHVVPDAPAECPGGARRGRDPRPWAGRRDAPSQCGRDGHTGRGCRWRRNFGGDAAFAGT